MCTVEKPQQVILMWLTCLKSEIQYLSMSCSHMRTRSAWGVLVDIALLFLSTKEVHSKKTFWLVVKYFKKQILKQLSISVFFHFHVIQLKTIYLQLLFFESTESECFLEIHIFSYPLTFMFHAGFVILLS